VREGRLIPFATMDEDAAEMNSLFLHPARHRHSLNVLIVEGRQSKLNAN
jgi:hypothetical protein